MFIILLDCIYYEVYGGSVGTPPLAKASTRVSTPCSCAASAVARCCGCCAPTAAPWSRQWPPAWPLQSWGTGRPPWAPIGSSWSSRLLRSTPSTSSCTSASSKHPFCSCLVAGRASKGLRNKPRHRRWGCKRAQVEISGVNIGRMIFKPNRLAFGAPPDFSRLTCRLYDNICPKTAENFRCLCNGERGACLYEL